jgi:hypothetical protein
MEGIEKSTERTLTARQRAFVELIADPTDSRAVSAKGVAAGFTERYAYRLARLPRVAAAIAQRTQEHVALLRARAGRVLSALADRAEAGDTKAAALFLEAVGMIGNRGVNVAIQNAVGMEGLSEEEARFARLPFAERLREVQAKRFVPHDLEERTARSREALDRLCDGENGGAK